MFSICNTRVISWSPGLRLAELDGVALCFAVASGMILIAFSVGTVANPCTCRIDRNTL